MDLSPDIAEEKYCIKAISYVERSFIKNCSLYTCDDIQDAVMYGYVDILSQNTSSYTQSQFYSLLNNAAKNCYIDQRQKTSTAFKTQNTQHPASFIDSSSDIVSSLNELNISALSLREILLKKRHQHPPKTMQKFA